MKQILWRAGRAALLGAVLAAGAWAQAVTSNLLGTISDTTGAVIPGVPVAVTEKQTGVSHRAVTNEQGIYNLPYIPPGEYRVEVEKEGFKKFIRENVILRIASSVRVDVTLEPGAVTEKMEVTADPPVLQTDRAEVSRSFERQAVRELPLANRNYQALVGLVAGVTPPSVGTSLEDPQGTNYFQANGQWVSANNSQVDGIDNNDPAIGVSIQVPPVEAISEVNVSTSNYSAEFGRAGGAVVNVVTRGGTNQLHGGLYEFHRNASLRARNLFNVSTQPKPAFVRNQFGGSLGGPIVANKTFFFVSFQGTRLRQATTSTTSVPVAAWRTGNFSGVPGLNIYDPATGNTDGTGRTLFANNQIPASRITSVAGTLTPYMPGANLTGYQSNYISNVGTSNDGSQYDVRIDHTFSSSTMAFLKYGYASYAMASEAALGRKIGDAVRNDQQTHTASFNLTHTFSPTLFSETRLGYNRYNPVANMIDRSITNKSLGIADPTPDPISLDGMARIDVSGMNGMGTSVTRPLVNADNIFNVSSSWTKMHGRHSLKWGVDVRRIRNDRAQPQGLGLGPRGLFTFNPGTTALKGGPALGSYGTFGNSFAAFLLGAADRLGRTYMPITPTNRQTNFFAFVQDSYQVSKKLTLDIGLRYELYTTVKPRYAGGASNYDPATNSLIIAGIGGVSMSTNVDSAPKNFAPRVGFSYRATEKSVIRGGYGISFFTGRYGFTGGTLSTQYPVISNIQVGVTGDYVVDGSFASIPAAPVVSVPSSGRITPAPSQAFYNIPQHNPYPYVQSMNLTYQRELGHGLTGDVAYVASLGRQLEYNQELNAAYPGTGTAGMALNKLFGRTASTVRRARGVNNNYNSLQTNLNKRFASGLTFTAAYTYSKALDVGSDQPSFTNNLDLGANYGLASFDRTHMFTASHLYELPFGKGKRLASSGPLAVVAGGWQLNGVFRVVSGTPFSIGADSSSCNCPGNSNYADAIGAVRILGGTGPGQYWFDRSAFAAPAANRFGTAGRNIVRGPGFANYDMSVFRAFPVTERAKVEFRSEFYNLTNTPRWGNPNSSVNSGNFGQITSTSGEREIQFALRLLF
jgi:hypothetical protein